MKGLSRAQIIIHDKNVWCKTILHRIILCIYRIRINDAPDSQWISIRYILHPLDIFTSDAARVGFSRNVIFNHRHPDDFHIHTKRKLEPAPFAVIKSCKQHHSC